jgi:hypothetical protein
MSFFEDASLVLIPSAIKDQKVYSVKPTDGTGDLTFSRASNATRVASNGLIEKVRTNLALRSQSFATSAVWSTANGTITNNAGTAPDGTNTASKIVATDADPYCYQPLTLSGQVTVSAFVKGIGSSIGKMGSIRGGATLNNFTITGDWQRVSVVHNAGGAQNYGVETPEAASVSDEVLLWGFQVETGDIATDYIATTTTAVSVGPVSGLPRLDYLNSTCPRLLLEPQRSNLALYSEQFNLWSDALGCDIFANTAVSPDGYQSADTLTFGANADSRAFRTTSFSSATYTFSVYAKSSTGKKFRFRISDSAGTQYSADQTTTSTWQRFTYQFTGDPTAIGIANEVGALGGSIDVWGFQAEAGAYATSYIPTLGTSVTRVADAASKTGISSLIGQTEGTIYWEGTIDGKNSSNEAIPISLFATGANTNGIQAYIAVLSTNAIRFLSYDGSSIQCSISTNNSFWTAGTKLKMAGAYKANDFVFYINGVQIGTDTSGNVSAFSELYLDYQNNQGEQSVDQILLFKTRLTNAQLAELTTL